MATTTYIKDIDITSGGSTNSYLIEPALYGAASTSDSGSTYTVTMPAGFTLITGATIQVKFAVTNAVNATLKVNTLDAKSIYYNNEQIAANTFKANHVYTLVYDGSKWQVVGDIDTNTQRPIGTDADDAAAGNHGHGNISNGGALSAANQAVVTDGSNKITTEDLSSSTPAASGTATAFITGITQNAKGKLTSITKANLPTASDSVAGITKLGATGGAATYGHTHGNINNDGTIGTANAIRAVVTNASNQITTDNFTQDSPVVPTSGTTTSLEFIDTVSQGASGKITATKKKIPNISKDTAGLAPKGAAVSTQSQSTKFLREDGSWAAPSYTTNTDQKVKQNANTENKEFSVLLKTTNDINTETGEVKFGATSDKLVTVNPNTGTLTAKTFSGALALSNITGADDLKAIEALTGTSGLLKKTAANTWALDTTAYATQTTVNGLLAAADAMIFKGTLGTGGTITAVPDGTSGKEYQAGYTYKIITAGTYAGMVCEIGDLLIAIADSTSGQTEVNDAHWTVAQTNIDGAVTGPASVTTTGNIAIFDGTTGKIIKDSGTTIANATVAKAGAANLTTTTNALAYYSNITGTFANGQYVTYLAHTAAKAGTNQAGYLDGLLISGTAYGNTAADLISNTVGVLSYGDAGPQIRFTCGEQSGALLFTHHDRVSEMGVTFNFVTNQGNAAVKASGLIATTRAAIGYNVVDSNYVLKVNGATYINGATTINNNLDITAGTIYFGKSATNKAILAYNSNNTKFGIWYHEGDTDVMRFSASGNADSNTTADFAINALGAGILSNRNNRIPHTGNTTGSVGGTTTPVYVDEGQIKALSYTIAKSVPSNAVFTDHYAWGDITSKPTSIALTGAVTANATTLGSGAISITTTVNHGHGYISSTGQITETHQITNGDRLIVTDSANATTEDKNKLIATTIIFDGSTTSKALTQKGTWETFNNYSHPTGDGNLHVPANGTGNNGKFLQATGTAGTYQWASVTKNTVGLDNVTNDKQLPIAGGTLTGAVNTANNTWNKIGDDVQIGDINEAGTLGVQGLNGNTGIRFTTYNQTAKQTGGKITWDGTKFIITSTTPISASISGNAATATSATSAASATDATNATNDEDGYNIKNTYMQRYVQTVDLTGDDTSTWYPVTIPIPANGMHRVSCVVHLDSGSKPSWSSHNGGYTAIVEMLVTGYGWGTTSAHSICLTNNQMWLASNEPIPVGYSQFGNSSKACFWCRGGAKYKLLTDFIGTWTVYRESTTVSSQTIAPRTSNPGISITRSTITANISHANAANLTSTKNAIAYYSDVNGTFASKASANGVLYATEANGALSWGTLPVAQGGTGNTSYTASRLLYTNTATKFATSSIVFDGTHVYPAENDTSELGSASYFWKKLYATQVIASTSIQTNDGKVGINADNEGGNIYLLSKSSTYRIEMDAYNDEVFRIFRQTRNTSTGALSGYKVLLSCDLSTGNITATTFTGNVTGNLTGTASSVSRATFGDSSNGSHDCNAIKSNGLWYYSSNGPSGLGNYTTDGALYSQAHSTSWVGQIAQDYRTGSLFVRSNKNGTWQSWKAIPNGIPYIMTNQYITYDASTKKFEAIGGSAGWNKHAYSTVGYKECKVTYIIDQNNKAIMVGLNSDPTTDASYSSIDYCWYTTDDNKLYIYESNSNKQTVANPYAAGDELTIEYVDGYVIYYYNGVRKRAVKRDLGSKLYFDSSFYHTSGSISGFIFEPITISMKDRYVNIFNTADFGDTSTVTFNDLAAAGNAVGMINAATDNPTGSAKWVHGISLCWSKGVNTSWISQIGIGVGDGNGLWYRTGSGTIVSRAWKRVLDSSNYTSYALASTTVVNTVKQTAKTDNVKYKLLACANASPTSGTNYEAVYDAKVYVNPSLNQIAVGQLTVHDKAATPVEKVTLQWNSTDSSLDFIFA